MAEASTTLSMGNYKAFTGRLKAARRVRVVKYDPYAGYSAGWSADEEPSGEPIEVRGFCSMDADFREPADPGLKPYLKWPADERALAEPTDLEKLYSIGADFTECASPAIKPYLELVARIQEWERQVAPLDFRNLKGLWLNAEGAVHQEKVQAREIVLRGKVESVKGNIAHVTLTDDQGRETFADCGVADLLAHGIDDGGLFECRIQDRGREAVVTLEPVSERMLTLDEWQRISNDVDKALPDSVLADDY